MLNSLLKYQKVSVTEFNNQVPKNPLVSVCVQTYQHGKYIRQCLEGILAQKTRFPFEILIGEDESTDETREICSEYAQKFPDKIRLFLHTRKNVIFIDKHPSGRFNFFWSLTNARGKYIALCDGDDFWTNPDKLQLQTEFMETNPEISLCYTNFNLVNESGEIIQTNGIQKRYKKSPLKYPEILEYYTPKVLTTIFRSEFLPQNPPSEIYKVRNSDIFLFSLIAQKGPAAYLDINSGNYRLNKQSMWSMKSLLTQKEMALKTAFEMKKCFTSEEEQQAIDSRISRTYLFMAGAYLKKLHFIKSFDLIFKSLKLSTRPLQNLIGFKFRSL